MIVCDTCIHRPAGYKRCKLGLSIHIHKCSSYRLDTYPEVKQAVQNWINEVNRKKLAEYLEAHR